jgi:hypothetical protein
MLGVKVRNIGCALACAFKPLKKVKKSKKINFLSAVIAEMLCGGCYCKLEDVKTGKKTTRKGANSVNKSANLVMIFGQL